jgi:hypothetical protein
LTTKFASAIRKVDGSAKGVELFLRSNTQPILFNGLSRVNVMKTMHFKITLLFAAFIVLSFYHNFKSLHKGIQRYNRYELDQITLYENRFADLKAVLQNQLIVGYVSDYDDSSDENGIAFRMTQYVLSPILLVRGTKHDFIVGNFQRSKPNYKAFEKENLSMYKDFGDGAILFEGMDN